MRFADRLELLDLADAVDMARYQVAADEVGQAHRLFEIHLATRRIEADRAVQRLARDIDLVAALFLRDHRQADAAVGDRIAQRDIAELEPRGFDGEAQALFQRLDVADLSYCGNDAGEHGGSKAIV